MYREGSRLSIVTALTKPTEPQVAEDLSLESNASDLSLLHPLSPS